jgi:hypothetical protein
MVTKTANFIDAAKQAGGDVKSIGASASYCNY